MAKKIKLGLLGCGTVGTGVLKVLQENYHDIKAKIGNDIEVSKVLVRNLNKNVILMEMLFLQITLMIF